MYFLIMILVVTIHLEDSHVITYAFAAPGQETERPIVLGHQFIKVRGNSLHRSLEIDAPEHTWGDIQSD